MKREMNAGYSEGFKERAPLKVFGRGTRTIQSVADELNISGYTPQDWLPDEHLVALH